VLSTDHGRAICEAGVLKGNEVFVSAREERLSPDLITSKEETEKPLKKQAELLGFFNA